jgi:hypothetical protein
MLRRASVRELNHKNTNNTETGEGTPLKIIKNVNPLKLEPLKFHNTQLRELRSIDSSSDEEGGLGLGVPVQLTQESEQRLQKT